MTLHRKHSQKREKSKITLPLQPDTILLQKKEKTQKSLKNQTKQKQIFTQKSNSHSRADSLNIKNILAIVHKVHSVLV